MSKNNKKISAFLKEVLPLLVILLLGAFFRFYGINWDENFHLHPDERFLTMVETSIAPVDSLAEYFNTSQSSLNPHNVLDTNGNQVFPFFVYGTYPIVLVRYIAEWLGMTGYNEVHIIGRYLSGLFDIGTIVVVYLISKEIQQKKWLPYLAALFYACAILPIQISHFFIVDNFATFFSALAVFFAVRIQKFEEGKHLSKNEQGFHNAFINYWDGFKLYALFAIMVGLAAASKINTIVIAALLPVAVFFKKDDWPKDLSNFKWKLRFRNLFLAGVICILVFRIFQPYAFSGPGFFGILPNPKWIANLQELSFISSGESNYPPSIQWARRSFWFPIKNMIVWGLGLPIGILSIGGLIWIAVKLIKGENREFTLLWFFTFLYLVWQAMRWNPTMRYFLIIYPIMMIMAAWACGQLVNGVAKIQRAWVKNLLSGIVIIAMLGLAILSALSFMNIYRQPMTRIAASEWIYQHVPGAINLTLADGGKEFIQPLACPNYTILNPGDSITFEFLPIFEGEITSINFDHIINLSGSDTSSAVNIVISSDNTGEVLYSQTVRGTFLRTSDPRGDPLEIFLEKPIRLKKGQQYRFFLSSINLHDQLQLFGNINLEITSENSVFNQPIFEFTHLLDNANGFEERFSPIQDSLLTGIYFFRWLPVDEVTSVEADIRIIELNSEKELVHQIFQIEANELRDYRGSPVSLFFDQPILLSKNNTYILDIQLQNIDAKIAVNGSKTVKETDWDDALPLYMYGYDPFDIYKGVYASDLNFQMYWDDDANKLDRFLQGLYQADYFIITSNRQWGSITQIPERYPLSTYFYRQLIGCQVDDVQWCYRTAKPGDFKGLLGFDLVKTFQVNPSIFGIEFNSQFAEEAFTVYDHPKVLIFEKSVDFNFDDVVLQLSSINLDHVLNISIKESEQRPGLLMLEYSHYLLQKVSGTWSELFNSQALINSNQGVAAAVWYLFITLLGWISYPFVRTAFGGLSDKGFPLSKLIGLILWAFITWFGSSCGIEFSRRFIAFAFYFFVIFNLIIFIKDKKEITTEITQEWKYFLTVDIITLLFFLYFLLVRLGNPDLWHPYKGGEKPMDFAYFNAIVKSVKFPPYDPWYAGGYINYYYFGFVLSAVPVKLLGITPSVAYNLILPTFFSFTAAAAFSLGWNLFNSKSEKADTQDWSIFNNPYFWGLSIAILVLFIGNLGSITMFFQGILKLGIDGANAIGIGFIDKLIFFFKGLIRFLQGANFGYYPGDWYWIPSRAIPGNVITEFPYFTFLYGDPHAHLFAYPITLGVLAWSLSIVLGKLDFYNQRDLISKLLCGALIIGSLRPTNTWDYPVFLAVGCISLLYSIKTKCQLPAKFLPYTNKKFKLPIFSAFIIFIFIGLTVVLYSPFDRWYGQAYTSFELWRGERTPLWAYFNHWGFFLFILISWVVHYILHWMKSTPLSALEPFYRHRKYIYLTALLLFFIVVALYAYGIEISIIVIPLIVILLILLVFDKNASESKLFTYFLACIGLGLTLMVEMVTLKGDIGRMNMVFKFYLQAWTFISISSGFLLLDLFSEFQRTEEARDRAVWKFLLGLLLFSVLLFPLTASIDKINDRMNEETPLTLDGMEFMKYSTYPENDVLMDLSQDYFAIRWMQENIKGTPVIVEGNTSEYRWGSRFSIYTGLPNVIGWNWHQRQQRAINPDEWVFERIDDVREFYSTTDINVAKDFIRQYDVEYIILGQLEKSIYPQEALSKFEQYSGDLWDNVYEIADTSIFKVKLEN